MPRESFMRSTLTFMVVFNSFVSSISLFDQQHLLSIKELCIISAKLIIIPWIVGIFINIWCFAHSSFMEELYLYNENDTPKRNVCKIGHKIDWIKINAEFSLQSASHNSREINQQQSGSQIRELWAMFVTVCFWICYGSSSSFSSIFPPFFSVNPLR